MTMHGGRRGQPVLVLLVVLGGWVCLRIAVLSDLWWLAARSPRVAVAPPATGHAGLHGQPDPGPAQASPPPRAIGSALRLASGTDRPAIGEDARAGLAVPVTWLDSSRSGHPDRPAPAEPEPATPPSAHFDPPLSPRGPLAAEPPAFTAEAWLLVRAAMPGSSAPGPTYGDSQAGVVLRRHWGDGPGPRWLAYLRGSAALRAPARDVAFGLDLRGGSRVRVDALAELRVVDTGRTRVVRPVLGLIGQTGPYRLPAGLVASGYAQAGWVGGRDEVVYGDAQVLVDRPVGDGRLGRFRLGLAGWSSGQTGASRVDVGPTVSLVVPLGPAVRARVQGDWRQRVAGNAAPGSGPAVVVSASF